MSENNPSLDNVHASVAGEGEQPTAANDEHKTPKMKDTGNIQPKKRGRKPKVVAAQEAEKSEEEFKPEKEGFDGDEAHSPKSKRRSNKGDDEDDDEDEDEEYGSGDESDDDYNGKKQLKKKVSRNSSAKKPASGAKRGRKPKSQAQKDAEETEKKAVAAANIAQAGTSEASQNETNDVEKETEGTTSTPSLPKGKRVTRTSSGRLPTQHEVFQPTFKKYKPTKKEEEANNQAGEASQATEQSAETSGKHETNGKGDTSLNSTGGDDQVNAKRAHSALEGTSPTNILTQAEFHEEDPEKKLKTDSS